MALLFQGTLHFLFLRANSVTLGGGDFAYYAPWHWKGFLLSLEDVAFN